MQGLEIRMRKKEPEGGKHDYRYHRWCIREIALEICKCTGLVILFSYFFYRSVWAVIPLGFLGIVCWQNDNRHRIAVDKHRLLLQFRDLIQAVAAQMRAGYSVENSFLECYPDMCMMHGREAFVCRELKTIQRGLAINITLEELLVDFGKRSDMQQLQEFAAVFSIAKRCGGNMSEVIRASAGLIQRRVEIREEILTQTAGRRMERNIMLVMPFLLISYIEIGSPGFFDVLYHNIQGILIMSGCMTVYLASYEISEYILQKAKDVEGGENELG